MFAWETTRQEDNMAASEWEDASCLQQCPYVLSVRRWRLSDAGLCFDLAFDHIKNRKHPNQTGIFRVFKICSLECYIFSELLHTYIRDLFCRSKFSHFSLIALIKSFFKKNSKQLF